jgi:hypothetical protein
MSDDRQPGDTAPAGGKKSHRHHTDRSGWPPPDHVKGGPQPTRSGKTMHHPAFRIGEIKHGK